MAPLELRNAPGSAALVSNMASIDSIPADRIPASERASYRQRAAAGEDVYAYSSGDDWYLWDWDTRIPLPPLVDVRYRLLTATLESGSQWAITVREQGDTTPITVHTHIDHLFIDRSLDVYLERGRRYCLMIVADVNKWHHPITMIDGVHI